MKMYKYKVTFSGLNDRRTVYIKSFYDPSHHINIFAFVYRMLVAKYGMPYVHTLNCGLSLSLVKEYS